MLHDILSMVNGDATFLSSTSHYLLVPVLQCSTDFKFILIAQIEWNLRVIALTLDIVERQFTSTILGMSWKSYRNISDCA